jgi:SsrA-binding protein
LLNTHISPYSHAYLKREEDATRTRKLLAHKRELNKLIGKVATKGITLIPLKMYINKKGRIKVEIGLCKHKKAHQKREVLKERDIKRETQRELKNYQ